MVVGRKYRSAKMPMPSPRRVLHEDDIIGHGKVGARLNEVECIIVSFEVVNVDYHMNSVIRLVT